MELLNELLCKFKYGYDAAGRDHFRYVLGFCAASNIED